MISKKKFYKYHIETKVVPSQHFAIQRMCIILIKFFIKTLFGFSSD